MRQGKKEQDELDENLRDAARSGDDVWIADLLERGANPKAFEKGGMAFNAIMIAAHAESARALEVLTAHCDAKSKNRKGETALMIAAGRGNEEAVRLLLPISNAKAKDGSGWTALMWAAKEGRAQCAMALIPQSDPKAKDKKGWTALMFAAARSHKCLDLLLPVSNVHETNHDGQGALTIAIKSVEERIDQRDAIDCMRRLIPLSDLDMEDKDGRNAISWAGEFTGPAGRKIAQEMRALSEQRALRREVANPGNPAGPIGGMAASKKPPRL